MGDSCARNLGVGMFDSSPLAFCAIQVVLDQEGAPSDLIFAYANEALAKLAGVPRERLVGSRFYEVFPDGDRKWLKPSYEAAYLGTPSEFTSISEEVGSYLYIVVSPCQEKGMATVVLRDVKRETVEKERHAEELEQALDSLQKEKRFLDSLTHDFTACYFIDLMTGKAEVIKLSNSTNAHELLGDAESKTIDFPQLVRKYSDAFTLTRQDAQRMREFFSLEHLREELCQKERFTYRYESVPSEHGKRYYEGQVIRVQMDPGAFTAIIGFRYIDDTIKGELDYESALKQALEEARLNNEIISAISKIYFSIFRIRLLDDTYEEVSREGEMHRLSGTHGSASQMLRRLCHERVSVEHQQPVLAFFDFTTLPGRLSQDDSVGIEYQTSNGDWHFSRFIAKHRDEEGRVTHVLLVTSSVSDAKRREERLAVIASQAKTQAKASLEFLSKLAHDIRTPMNAIKGFGLIATAQIDDRQKALYALKRLDESCDYLCRLMDDVLDLTDIEDGRMALRPRRISLSEMMKPFQFDFNMGGKPGGMRYSCLVHDIEHDSIMVDDVRLAQVINNLLSNAVNFTPADGAVTLELWQEQVATPGRCMLCLSVADTGRGISPEFIDKVYDSFSREEDTRINKVRGVGLGLTIVKDIVDLLGGTIEVSSELGKGSTFTVRFEVECAPADKAEPPRTSQVAPRPDLKVLVAEDNDLNWEVASTLLEMHGVTCKRACDGKECVNLFIDAAEKFDAILMDMQMPVMNGLEATSEIRRLEAKRGSHVPIIALTANAFATDEQQCLQAGMDAHLSKPFAIDAVLAKLDTLCLAS